MKGEETKERKNRTGSQCSDIWKDDSRSRGYSCGRRELPVLLLLAFVGGFLMLQIDSSLTTWTVKVRMRQDQTVKLVHAGNNKAMGDELPAHLPSLCGREKSFLPKTPTTRVVQLASYPGSGNTWTRTLIEEGLRLYTGSVYHGRGQDDDLVSRFKGENQQIWKTIVVKTHFPCQGCWLSYNPKGNPRRMPVPASRSGDIEQAVASIYIIRSPFDAILAEYKRKLTSNHTGVLGPKYFQGTKFQKWEMFVKSRTNSWVRNVAFYAADTENLNNGSAVLKPGEHTDERGRPIYLIYYEDLKSDVFNTIKGAFDFLAAVRDDIELSDSFEAASCAEYSTIKHQTESYHRKMKHEFNPFTSKQISWICGRTQRFWQEWKWGPCNGMLQRQREQESALELQTNS